MFESRGFSLLIAFLCYQLLVTAYYFQFVEGMEPCPLCIFQRVAVLFVGIFFLLRGVHNAPTKSRFHLVYSSLALISSLLGGGIAARHVYIRNLPDGEVPACGPALDYLVEMLPINEVISAVLVGDGECAKGDWSFLGLSMPGWVLLFFIGVSIYLIWNIYRYYSLRKNGFEY